ncbi:hypothetical protein DL89DRAFT_126517 [Linderina pennispora]|uniref:Uncharacterized protein n=1 Tax=Linderina pennispora TaxID=61395 RepID=A0A1Y1WDJ1_9FUNG|nr:uncharacterized protein DL89DRAFT_126517 [Linderina pennispora]ORX71455.1 hypothetical protein DL89DRAFT_126517 [Linderina pennispora]
MCIQLACTSLWQEGQNTERLALGECTGARPGFRNQTKTNPLTLSTRSTFARVGVMSVFSTRELRCLKSRLNRPAAYMHEAQNGSLVSPAIVVQRRPPSPWSVLRGRARSLNANQNRWLGAFCVLFSVTYRRVLGVWWPGSWDWCCGSTHAERQYSKNSICCRHHKSTWACARACGVEDAESKKLVQIKVPAVRKKQEAGTENE